MGSDSAFGEPFYGPEGKEIKTLDLTTVLAMVKKERKRQDEMWGYPQVHHPMEWLSILAEEFGELAQALNNALFGGDGDLTHAREEAIEVAAVAVAFVEHLGGTV